MHWQQWGLRDDSKRDVHTNNCLINQRLLEWHFCTRQLESCLILLWCRHTCPLSLTHKQRVYTQVSRVIEDMVANSQRSVARSGFSSRIRQEQVGLRDRGERESFMWPQTEDPERICTVSKLAHTDRLKIVTQCINQIILYKQDNY